MATKPSGPDEAGIDALLSFVRRRELVVPGQRVGPAPAEFLAAVQASGRGRFAPQFRCVPDADTGRLILEAVRSRRGDRRSSREALPSDPCLSE